MVFRSRYSVKTLIVVGLVVLLVQAISHFLFNLAGNSLDNKAGDVLYRYANDNGTTPKPSSRVVFLNINDLTYEYLKSNQLDRKFLATAINDLSSFSPDAVMFDIIFARPSDNRSDSVFASALRDAGNICLPAGFSASLEKHSGFEREGTYYSRLMNEFRIFPKEIGSGEPFYAGRGLAQEDRFAAAAATSGHITALSESDGVYRFYPLVLKLDSGYIPTTTIAMFCKIFQVNTDSIIINWGESFTIPALKDSKLEKDVVIPIDEHGQTYIPYPVKWQEDKRKMEIKNFISRADNPELTDELTSFFEGNVVFIGDVSTGISDSGPTTLDNAAPLVVIHAALMNALMTDSFFKAVKNSWFMFAVFIVTLVLTGVSVFKNGLYFHTLFGLFIILSIPFSYYLVTERMIFPLITFQANILGAYLALLVTVQYTAAKEQSFIKSAFSRYLSPSVVDRLIDNPESLKLGGEERELTVLFSDIAGFTTISETTKPADLVKALNEYFTEMTKIVTGNGGIIDKYIGDAIMAEFGAPLHFDGHETAAVKAALEMQKKCGELNKNRANTGFPEIRMRVGINTGGVILGNMGSQQVFDYTVVGDTVNLASRLEGAGKLYGVNIMISEPVYDKIKNSDIRTRALDIIKVKGKNHSVKVYEVISDGVFRQLAEYFETFDQALQLYFVKSFGKSEELFNQCVKLKPGDPASLEFLRRINYLKNDPPPDDWDGSFTMKEK